MYNYVCSAALVCVHMLKAVPLRCWLVPPGRSSRWHPVCTCGDICTSGRGSFHWHRTGTCSKPEQERERMRFTWFMYLFHSCLFVSTSLNVLWWSLSFLILPQWLPGWQATMKNIKKCNCKEEKLNIWHFNLQVAAPWQTQRCSVC